MAFCQYIDKIDFFNANFLRGFWLFPYIDKIAFINATSEAYATYWQKSEPLLSLTFVFNLGNNLLLWEVEADWLAMKLCHIGTGNFGFDISALRNLILPLE